MGMSLAYIILTGFLVRADGWGTNDANYQWAAKFFNAITCSLIFALLTTFYTTPIAALASGLAFWVIRAPGFDGWENWLNMYWRGFWTSFLGLTLVSLAANSNPYGGLLSVPFAGLFMLAYAGGYKWLPDKVLGFSKHVWIEHATGWLIGASILLVS
jgi:hypothetical protein